MPMAPCPTHGSMSFTSSNTASNPSGTASPCSFPSGVMLKFRRVMPAKREHSGVQFRAIGDLLHAVW